MDSDPTTPTWRRWWTNQSRGRKAAMVGGAAIVALATGSAAAGETERTARADPATTASAGEPSSRASAVAPVTTEGPTITEHPRTTAAPATTASPARREVPPTTAGPATTAAPATTVAPPTTPPVTYTVTHTVDGDTLDATPSDGSPAVRVRLVGIDAPEQGTCEADAATMTLAGLVQDRQIVLTPGGDGEDTDAYGRSLRYIDIDGMDAGLRLIENGFAIARYDSRDGYGAHAREGTYVAADAASPPFVCPPPPTPAPSPPPPPPAPAVVPAPPPPIQPAAPAPPNSGCDPNYSGCVPIDSDVDCAGGSGNGPSYTGHVRVVGTDIYDLDRDGDGEACE